MVDGRASEIDQVLAERVVEMDKGEGAVCFGCSFPAGVESVGTCQAGQTKTTLINCRLEEPTASRDWNRREKKYSPPFVSHTSTADQHVVLRPGRPVLYLGPPDQCHCNPLRRQISRQNRLGKHTNRDAVWRRPRHDQRKSKNDQSDCFSADINENPSYRHQSTNHHLRTRPGINAKRKKKDEKKKGLVVQA